MEWEDGMEKEVEGPQPCRSCLPGTNHGRAGAAQEPSHAVGSQGTLKPQRLGGGGGPAAAACSVCCRALQGADVTVYGIKAWQQHSQGISSPGASSCTRGGRGWWGHRARLCCMAPAEPATL